MSFPLNFNDFDPIVIGADWSIVFGLSNDDGSAVSLSGWTFTHEMKDPSGVVVGSGTVSVSGSTTTSTVNGITYTYYPVTITIPHATTAGFLPMTATYSIESAVGGIITPRFYGTQTIMAVA